MKNKFLTGFLSGLTVTFIIFTIVFTVFFKDLSKDFFVDFQTLSEDSEGNSTFTKSVNKKVKKLETLIKKYYIEDVDESRLTDGIYKGIMWSLNDPYSVYYNEEEYKALQESSSGIYSGIGASVSQNIKSGIITVVKPFVTGPAYKEGVLPGDVLYSIDGEEVTGRDLTEVVAKMKGKEGTKVHISIIREGETELLEFDIVRKEIEVPTIEYEMLEGNIGYILVTEFEEVTAKQFKAAIYDLEKQGQEGLIVDVRNNPGGRLDVVVDMLDRILPKGLIVYTEDKYGNREEERSTDKEQFKKPLVVLTNGNSASASEIFAGAVQDYEIGTIVGTTTYGKGIVQSVIPLLDGTAIKITASKYFTPKGRNIHEIGIEPDVNVELDEDLRKKPVIAKEEDNQLQKGIEIINNKLK